MAAITASIQAVATPKVAVKADARKSVKAVASLKPATAAKVVLSNNVEADSMQVRRLYKFPGLLEGFRSALPNRTGSQHPHDGVLPHHLSRNGSYTREQKTRLHAQQDVSY